MSKSIKAMADWMKQATIIKTYLKMFFKKKLHYANWGADIIYFLNIRIISWKSGIEETLIDAGMIYSILLGLIVRITAKSYL